VVRDRTLRYHRSIHRDHSCQPPHDTTSPLPSPLHTTLTLLTLVCLVQMTRIDVCCWQENPKSLLFYCGTLPALYTVDQRRILFYKKLTHHSSILLIRTIARLCQYDILSVAAKYGIYRLDNSVSFIKKFVWKTFAASARFFSCFFSVVFYVYCIHHVLYVCMSVCLAASA